MIAALRRGLVFMMIVALSPRESSSLEKEPPSWQKRETLPYLFAICRLKRLSPVY